MLLKTLSLLYAVCALLLSLYAAGVSYLLVVYWLHRHDRVDAPPIDNLPTVAVQLPLYNERHVVARLLDAVAALDYPRHLLTVQVLDDSTDDTTGIVAQKAAELRATGLDVQHIRRENRVGFKAGALAHGDALLDSEFVMVLDADFVPEPDFLRRTIPFLVADETLGMVQTRWGHLNPTDNPLTFGQTLAIDGHFVVEQTARSRAGWLMSFNGSGGVWRTACIRAAGGWRDTTLTEDLDLSYRAQLVGWRFLYLPDVVVPGELPPQMSAYKRQQARWAKGNTQTLTRTLRPLWNARLTFTQRVMATMHLCQYMPHPLMLLMLLLTPPLMATHAIEAIPLRPLALVGLGPPLLFVVSQRALYPNWRWRLLAFPVLMAIGTGLAWNNTRAVFGGLWGERGEFLRTPKFAGGSRGSLYALRADASLLVELGLAFYAAWGAWVAANTYPALVPYLALYGFAFAAVALWSLWDGV